MSKIITIHRDVQESAKHDAEQFRSQMTQAGTLVVNLLSSPGSGKTALLAETCKRLKDQFRIAVLVGDIATDRDAQRINPYAPTIQLTTGGACHLSLSLVMRGIEAIGTEPLDFLFIENVGNLVCPSSHDLGEHTRVVLLSTTEGDDKPAKYPKAFRTSHAVVISKTDLLPYLPFSVPAAAEDARKIQPNLEVIPLSALRNEGLDNWIDFLLRQRACHSPNAHPSTCGQNG